MKFFSPALYCFNFPCDSAVASYPAYELLSPALFWWCPYKTRKKRPATILMGRGGSWNDSDSQNNRNRPDGNWDDSGNTIGDCNLSRNFSLKLWGKKGVLISGNQHCSDLGWVNLLLTSPVSFFLCMAMCVWLSKNRALAYQSSVLPSVTSLRNVYWIVL